MVNLPGTEATLTATALFLLWRRRLLSVLHLKWSLEPKLDSTDCIRTYGRRAALGRAIVCSRRGRRSLVVVFTPIALLGRVAILKNISTTSRNQPLAIYPKNFNS